MTTGTTGVALGASTGVQARALRLAIGSGGSEVRPKQLSGTEHKTGRVSDDDST